MRKRPAYHALRRAFTPGASCSGTGFAVGLLFRQIQAVGGFRGIFMKYTMVSPPLTVVFFGLAAVLVYLVM